MERRNKVYIAASIDGYIADRNGGLDWLHSVPNPDQSDMGYTAFIQTIDAIVMGRNTFDVVCSFDIKWPYPKPVFVLSNSMKSIPQKYRQYATLLKGDVSHLLAELHAKGFNNLYIDGGTTIQNFLAEDKVDDLIVTRIPILLGGGSPLFSNLPKELEFEHVKTEVLLGQIVQSHYKRAGKE